MTPALITATTALPRRSSRSRASWTEYQRLRTVGVNPHSAAVLAAGPQLPEDSEAAYRRQLAMGLPTSPAARRAHAAARQRRRRHRSGLSTGRL